jgi:predicted aspartyl protease
VQVNISLHQAFSTQLAQRGMALPAPVSGFGLIDTGASSSCIDEQVALSMALPAIDVVTMASASHPSTACNVYPVMFELIGFSIRVEIPRAIGANLRAQGIVALLGRDVLANGTLFYNGITGQITFGV